MKAAVVSLTLAIVAFASVALASTLGVGSVDVGAGNAAVPRCDADGFTYSFTTSRGAVTQVSVGDIADPGCEGSELSLTLTNAGGTSVATAGPQTVPADGDGLANSMTLAVSPQPTASQVLGINVLVEGP